MWRLKAVLLSQRSERARELSSSSVLAQGSNNNNSSAFFFPPSLASVFLSSVPSPHFSCHFPQRPHPFSFLLSDTFLSFPIHLCSLSPMQNFPSLKFVPSAAIFHPRPRRCHSFPLIVWLTVVSPGRSAALLLCEPVLRPHWDTLSAPDCLHRPVLSRCLLKLQ